MYIYIHHTIHFFPRVINIHGFLSIRLIANLFVQVFGGFFEGLLSVHIGYAFHGYQIRQTLLALP